VNRCSSLICKAVLNGHFHIPCWQEQERKQRTLQMGACCGFVLTLMLIKHVCVQECVNYINNNAGIASSLLSVLSWVVRFQRKWGRHCGASLTAVFMCQSLTARRRLISSCSSLTELATVFSLGYELITSKNQCVWKSVLEIVIFSFWCLAVGAQLDQYRSVPLIRPLQKYAPPLFTAKVPA